MTGFTTYRYNDEIIPDINAWARERGEKMVVFKRYRDVPNIFSGRVEREEETGRKPESFYDAHCEMHGWIYEEIERVDP